MTNYEYQKIDDIIHSRIRLSIIALLVSRGNASFIYIRDKIKATDGNLSIQLKKLEAANFISSTKKFVNRKPLSTYSITSFGRKAFSKYIERIESLIRLDDK